MSEAFPLRILRPSPDSRSPLLNMDNDPNQRIEEGDSIEKGRPGPQYVVQSNPQYALIRPSLMRGC